MNVTIPSIVGILVRLDGSQLLSVATAIFFVVGIVQQGIAQEATLTGVWKCSRDANEQAQRYRAIDQVTQGMNGFMRGRARQALRAKTSPFPTIELTDEGDRVTFSRGERRFTFKTDGTPTRVNSERGTATARAQRKKEKLILTSQGRDGGVQTTVHSLSEDGTRLILDVSITAKMFKSPIRYKTTYRRVLTQSAQ